MLGYYFTYGTDGQPFVGGWTMVIAPNYDAACLAFRAFHPDRTPGILNCSDVYDDERFGLSEIYRRGNLGFRCHEIITLRRQAAYY